MKPLSHHATVKHGLEPKSDIECFQLLSCVWECGSVPAESEAVPGNQGAENVGVMGTSSYFTRAERWPLPIPLEDMEMTNSHSLEDINKGSLTFLMRNIIASYHQTIELSY